MTESFATAPEFDHSIAANEYGFYCIPRAFQRREVPRILQSGEVYEPATLRFMQHHAGKGDIVTGGAFVGDFFPALARALAPGARIHSFEPAPDSYAASRYTLALNRLTCVDLHPVAVGEAEATLPLQVARNQNALAAGARLIAISSADTIDVPVTTIDRLIPAERAVSILHLDIEGAELPALRGAHRLIETCAPIIIVETEASPRRQQIADFLTETFPGRRYSHTSVIENNSIFLPLYRS